MPKPVPLQYGKHYHIYNRGNNRENIFFEKRNYRHFLELYAKYIVPIADICVYCLLCNHFHFMVRIKDLKDLTGFPKPVRSRSLSQPFSNLFNAYAKAINKAYNRTGALFQRPFGRIEVASDAYFIWLVIYIHQNPQKHGLVDDFRTWSHSSYQTLLSTKPTRLERDDVLAWFDGVDNFVVLHQQEVTERKVALWVPEDFD